ncbi:MAG: cytochrome c biogenesis CcdA family protein [Paracoccaceae bacterium]
MDIIFAYLAGLLTLINPCVLPVLPIVLASSLNEDRRAPLMLSAGLSVAFVGLGLGLSALGPVFGIDPESVARIAALVMVGFGLVLLTPALGTRFATATAGFANGADRQIDTQAQRGLAGQFVSGALLGAVWSPCIGPTLGAAIALASTGESLMRAALVMTSFAAGVSTLILALAYGAQSAIRKRQHRLRAIAEKAKPIMGAVFVLVGTALWFRLHHIAEAWLLSVLPPWLIDLSVSL